MPPTHVVTLRLQSYGGVLPFRCGHESLFGLARKVLYQKERKPILIPLYRQPEGEIVERLVFEKASFWDYEDEYRITGHRGPHWGYTLDEQNRVSFPPELLCGITLGMKISAPDRQALLTLANTRNPRIPVWEAIESPLRFWLEAQRVR